MSVTILFDIGGTKMRVAASFDGTKLDATKTIPTPKDFDEGIIAFQGLARELAGGKPIGKVVGGIAAMLDKEKNVIFHSPNLLGWVGKPFKVEISRALGVEAVVENDAAIGGLGEAVLGAGKGFHSVMYMTVSTGVGGSRIVGGKIDEKVFSFQPGQQIIDMAHAVCPDCVVSTDRADSMGHLEDYTSGTAVARRFGKKAYEIPADDRLWGELSEWLACGLYNSILFWSPDAIVLGGSMILGGPAIDLGKVEVRLRELMNFFPDIPVIKKAALGDEGGLYGALTLSKE